jgi:hypothetical protein
LTSYRPHEDRGWQRLRFENIRKDLADINRQVDAPGIHGEDDMQQLCQSYLNLALNCVKARMFVELEAPKQLHEFHQGQDLAMKMCD